MYVSPFALTDDDVYPLITIFFITFLLNGNMYSISRIGKLADHGSHHTAKCGDSGHALDDDITIS